MLVYNIQCIIQCIIYFVRSIFSQFSQKGVQFSHFFSILQYICTGGSEERIRKFAEMAQEKCGGQEKIQNLATGGRFVMYKIGPVLAVNHGMGMGRTVIYIFSQIFTFMQTKCSINYKLCTPCFFAAFFFAFLLFLHLFLKNSFFA